MNTDINGFMPIRSEWKRFPFYIECHENNGKLEYHSYEVGIDDVLHFKERHEYVSQMHNMKQNKPRQQAAPAQNCPICHGSGVCIACKGEPTTSQKSTCSICNGAGHDYIGQSCTGCGGSGYSTSTISCRECDGTGLCPVCKKDEIENIIRQRNKRNRTIIELMLGKDISKPEKDFLDFIYGK